MYQDTSKNPNHQADCLFVVFKEAHFFSALSLPFFLFTLLPTSPSSTLIPLHNVSLHSIINTPHHTLVALYLVTPFTWEEEKNLKDDCLPPQAETIMSISLAHISGSDFVFFFLLSLTFLEEREENDKNDNNQIRTD